MHERKLSIQDTEFIVNLKKLGISNLEIAEKMGISEGAVRYRIKRFKSGATDRRKDKPSGLNSYHDFIASWIEEYKELTHRPTLKALYEQIRDYHHFSGSYDPPASGTAPYAAMCGNISLNLSKKVHGSESKHRRVS